MGAVLTAREINGTVFYGWNGTDGAEAMLSFIGTGEPRCLELPWYFRIFETGVMLGYPEGLTQINEIDSSGPDCVVLAASNTTEYRTAP